MPINDDGDVEDCVTVPKTVPPHKNTRWHQAGASCRLLLGLVSADSTGVAPSSPVSCVFLSAVPLGWLSDLPNLQPFRNERIVHGSC